jgi:hypothetical protein
MLTFDGMCVFCKNGHFRRENPKKGIDPTAGKRLVSKCRNEK